MNCERKELSFRFGQHGRTHIANTCAQTRARAHIHTHSRKHILSQNTVFERQNMTKEVKDEKRGEVGRGIRSQRETESEGKRHRKSESQLERTEERG